mgnify:CR=1 FL=1
MSGVAQARLADMANKFADGTVHQSAAGTAPGTRQQVVLIDTQARKA